MERTSQSGKAKFTDKRVGAKPAAGLHMVSGTWTEEKAELSDNARDFIYEQTADGMKMTDMTGGKYSAKFDGKAYPTEGMNSLDQVILRKIDAMTIEEKYLWKGELRITNRMTVSKDGKTLTVAWNDRSTGMSGTDYARKR